MSDAGCAEMQLLLQADIDGELRAAEAARVAAHLDRCPDCAEVQARLLALSVRLRADLPRYAMPAALRSAVMAAVAREAGARPAATRVRAWAVPGAAFGAGLALAACLAVFVVLPDRGGAADAPAGAVVAAHIRALQPGHLMDVASTDQHTVKPWFDGRLPYAPPVRDFAAAGFPLAGGRLDYLDSRPVAALVYRRALHVIELFVWPAGEPSEAARSGSRDGYNFVRWGQDGMTFWAVSDLNARELAAFAAEWRKAGG